MSPDVFDFRKPGRLPEDVAQFLSVWQRQIRSALEVRWIRHLPFPFQLAALQPCLFSRHDLFARYQQDVVTYRLDVGDAGDATAIVLPRAVALALVSGMLGDTTDQLPDDRLLTDIEKTLAQVLMKEIEGAVQESQPFRRPLTFVARGEHRLQEMHKEFPDTDPMLMVSFEMELPFGKHAIDWILSQAATLKIAAVASQPNEANRHSAAKLIEIMRSVPVEVIVRLGATTLHLSELAELRVGDVVVLNQRFAEPLRAEVGGCSKFTGWPGRVGSKQAFQIESLID